MFFYIYPGRIRLGYYQYMRELSANNDTSHSLTGQVTSFTSVGVDDSRFRAYRSQVMIRTKFRTGLATECEVSRYSICWV